MIKITNLNVSVHGKEILHNINLEILNGEIHILMGQNGSGKSTLSKVIAGHPDYEITSGKIEYKINGVYTNIKDLAPHERAREGIFLSFQYPVEVPGVSNIAFLKEAFNAICQHQGVAPMNEGEFRQYVTKICQELEMNESFLDRSVNEGFSGGEKKKNEILQMRILGPKLCLLDETDSGLDRDALQIVAKGVNQFKNKFNAFLIVTHYEKILELIPPHKVHVLKAGNIVKTGGVEIAQLIESKGYEAIHP